ncbi:MAG: hypothetical protein Q9187_002860 [Circinaria calcarea]
MATAILRQYQHFEISYLPYSAILPSADSSHFVAGLIKFGLAEGDIVLHDSHEGRYERKPVQVELELDTREKRMIDAEAHIWLLAYKGLVQVIKDNAR